MAGNSYRQCSCRFEHSFGWFLLDVGGVDGCFCSCGDSRVATLENWKEEREASGKFLEVDGPEGKRQRFLVGFLSLDVQQHRDVPSPAASATHLHAGSTGL